MLAAIFHRNRKQYIALVLNAVYFARELFVNKTDFFFSTISVTYSTVILRLRRDRKKLHAATPKMNQYFKLKDNSARQRN